jgi:UDP-glucose 4-epimerase
MVERILEAYDPAFGLRFVALRYFNAAGASATHGEDHDPETHLIPLVLQAARGVRPDIAVFGGDYPTPDGTAIRDYVHVADLADAHARALAYLRGGGASARLNLGTGRGYSVLEVIETARRVTGRPVAVRTQARRPGDPSRLVASAVLAREVLGWEPQYSELEAIIRTAWEWDLTHPEGYG